MVRTYLDFDSALILNKDSHGQSPSQTPSERDRSRCVFEASVTTWRSLANIIGLADAIDDRGGREAH